MSNISAFEKQGGWFSLYSAFGRVAFWSLRLAMRKAPRVCPWLRSAILPVIAGSLVLLAGCAVGPDYVRPEAETPPAYKELEGWKTAQPADNLVKGKWWEIFNDPELNSLEEQVSISNQNVAAAEAQYRQALAAVRAAQAGFFPTAAADVSVTKALPPNSGGTQSSQSAGTGSSTGTGGASTTRVSSYNYILNGNAIWEPDLWGKIRRTVEAGKASAEASAADLEAIRLSIQATLAEDYFLLRSLDSQKRLLDETVTAYQKSLHLTKNRYDNGIASKADVLLAETQLKSTEAQAIDIGVLRAQTEHAIALLIGKPASSYSCPVSALATTPPAIPVGFPSELLERRPDIAAAERLAAAANAQIGVAKAAYYPTLTLTASGGYSWNHLSNWLTWPNRFWSIGSSLAETVFDAGLRSALTDEAVASYEAAVASYRQTVLAAFQEVEDNLAALRILEKESLVQDEAVNASRKLLEVTLNQYKAGIVSYLNVIVAQAAKFNNETTAANILGRRMVASAALTKALGGGWDASALRYVNNTDGTVDK